jgi:hypothetical protein
MSARKRHGAFARLSPTNSGSRRASVNTSGKSTRSRRPTRLQHRRREKRLEFWAAQKAKRHLVRAARRATCRLSLRRIGCRECAAFGKAGNSARTPAPVSIVLRAAAERVPLADGLGNPDADAGPGRRTSCHTTCSMVIARFALLGLAELSRSAILTWARIVGSADIASQRVCPPSGCVEGYLPRGGGSSKDNALCQPLGHIRCLERVGGHANCSPAA